MELSNNITVEFQMIDRSWMQRIIVTLAVDYHGVTFQRISWGSSQCKYVLPIYVFPLGIIETLSIENVSTYYLV